ncbi:MAG: hypothetical protein HY726_16730 [Candidatus Rokubacteria bacterium]|nr:hypothetical protein [Candidatus Rokubacteria bacterium]
MLLASSRAIGVEIADTRLIVVEADPATDPLTIRAVSGEVSAAGLGASLRSALAQGGISARVVHLVLSEPDGIHRVQVLPPMRASERQLFLERELGREIGGNPLLGYTIVRQVEGTPRKDEVLVAAVPRKRTDQTLAALIAARLAPRLVTTAPLALWSAAQILSQPSFDRPTAAVHWGFHGLTVSVADEGVLRFSREIPHLAVPGLDAGEWFVTEFQRSIRQYMQAAKGRAVASVLVGSVDVRLERALPDVEARLGLPVVNLNEAVRALFPEGAEGVMAPSPGAIVLPLGAALLAPKATPNLLPLSILARRRVALLKRAAAAAAVLLVGSLGYSAWGAAQEAASYRKALTRLTAQRQARQAEAAQVERTKQERQTQYERIRLLKTDPLGAAPLAEVFKEISRVAPGELHLDRLALRRDHTGLSIRLTGAVESRDLARAQSEFNRFYFGLQGSPFFSQVIFNPPAASKVMLQQGPSPSVEGRTVRDIQRRAELAEDREGVLGKGKKLAFQLELRVREMK